MGQEAAANGLNLENAIGTSTLWSFLRTEHINTVQARDPITGKYNFGIVASLGALFSVSFTGPGFSSYALIPSYSKTSTQAAQSQTPVASYLASTASD